MELDVTPKHRHFSGNLLGVNHSIHYFKIKYIVNFQFMSREYQIKYKYVSQFRPDRQKNKLFSIRSLCAFSIKNRIPFYVTQVSRHSVAFVHFSDKLARCTRETEDAVVWSLSLATTKRSNIRTFVSCPKSVTTVTVC